jgi:FkbM family methyltransferase
MTAIERTAIGVRNHLRTVKFVRACAKFVRRVRKWHIIIPAYTSKLGCLDGLRVMAFTSLAQRIVKVRLAGLQEPLRIRPRTSDKLVFEQIFLQGEYDLETDFCPRLIVDAGANVGYASIYFATRWPNAQLVAIEPDPANFTVLLENLKAYPAIRAIQAALWPRHELLTLQTGREAWSSRVTTEDTGDARQVRAITLDEVLSILSASEIDLLKLDIEGSERELFDSPGPWLERTKIIVTELHDRIVPGCSEALERAIEKMDFSRSALGENLVLVRV